jgi:hypothetical protein
VIDEGCIKSTGYSSYPAWLRSGKIYENFDFRFDFLLKGWTSSGVFFNAPLHGRNSRVGFEYQIYHDRSPKLKSILSGSIFNVLPPLVNAIHPPREWNTARVLMDWPNLKMWLNGVLVQDIDVNDNDELKYRFRQGYLGIQDVGSQCWFKNLRIKELPSKEEWISLFNGVDFDGWYVEGQGAKWAVRDGVIHAEDNGSYLVTKDTFKDFELHCYVRSSQNANGGIFFRWNQLKGGDRGNEIQLENLPDSPHPTGSLYNIVRANQPYFLDEQWFPVQIRVQDTKVVVRVNGETTVDYDGLDIVRHGRISLQMHKDGSWMDWKDLKIKILK